MTSEQTGNQYSEQEDDERQNENESDHCQSFVSGNDANSTGQAVLLRGTSPCMRSAVRRSRAFDVRTTPSLRKGVVPTSLCIRRPGLLVPVGGFREDYGRTWWKVLDRHLVDGVERFDDRDIRHRINFLVDDTQARLARPIEDVLNR